MRTLFFGSVLFIFAFIQSGCNKADDLNQIISANLNWTQDVTAIDMSAFGIETAEISQNKNYELLPGEGSIYWVSAGVEYSKNINVVNSGIEDSENDNDCEQEGEHEGENEGCVFSFSFSGNSLSISNR